MSGSEQVDLSSESPNSMYSDDSPRCPDTNAFEYDELMLDHLEMDTTEYEALVDEEEGRNDDPSSPAWGRWPNQSSLGGPGWTPMPTYSSFRSGSIISISPRGSLSTSRRGSLPNRKLSDTPGRRSSLGGTHDTIDHDLANGRRRSSAKSQLSSRRRSSVMSNGTILDPMEDQRIRHLAGIGILARRFSELVEVIAPSPGEDEGMNDVTYAREMISRWSPYSTETDVSEIQTAPYIPTPQLAPPVPTIWSNYPLSSSVPLTREISLDTPDPDHQFVSPVFALRMPRFPIEYTPPPAREPIVQLTQRLRPGIVRALTDYVFPVAPIVDRLEIAPRPTARRAVSTPQLSSLPLAEVKSADPVTIPHSNSLRRCQAPTGSFPLARSHPLGISKLRVSTSRTSTEAGASSAPHRPSIVAERRISIVQLGPKAALMSRQLSRELSPKSTRRPSLQPLPVDMLQTPRKLSNASDLRRESLDPSRRGSSTSRKSSTLSLGEYNYLAGEIDPTVPFVPTAEARSSQTSMTQTESLSSSLSSRRNAPPSIVLPAYHFPPSPSALLSGSSSATPRYSPLDSFFGRTPSLTSSGSGGSTTVDPLSPWSDLPSPKAPGLHRSVIDRGRPISSPEFQDVFPLRSAYPGPHTKSTRDERNSSDPSTSSVQEHQPKTPRSPSYRFPVTPEGPERRYERKVKVAHLPVPLKSILVHRTGDSRVDPPSRPQAQRASTTFESSKDIQLLLRARHESIPVHRPTQEAVDSKKARPTIKHQSSFTRLFQRAKGHSPSSST